MNQPLAHASMFSSIRNTHGFRRARVEGALPDDLSGAIYRTGPGVFERFGRSIGHAFEADGVISAVRFGGGAAEIGVSVVQSRGWREEEAAGRALYSSAASLFDRLRVAFSGKDKASGNTRMWCWQGDLYALMEGAGPVRIDPDSLETLRETDFDGVIPRAFSAHPHYVPSRQAWFNFGVRYGRTMKIDLFACPDRGAASRITTVEVPFGAMVHDFIATHDALVLLICPAKLRLFRALVGWGEFADWFRWSPEDGGEAIVIPLDDPTSVQRFEIPAFWFWHVGKAWSDGRDVFADVSWYPNLDTLGEFAPMPATPVEPGELPEYRRLHLNLRTNQLDVGAACEAPLEFPQVHPGHLANPRASTFGLTAFETRGHLGTIRVTDDGATQRWRPDDREQASEPIIVPRGDADDDVWVLTLVHTDAQDESYLAVLDGQNVAAGPVARVWFDQPIPQTFHGTWVSAR